MGCQLNSQQTLRLFCMKGRIGACVALFYSTDIGESLCMVPGLHREQAKGDTPTIRDRRRYNVKTSTAHYPKQHTFVKNKKTRRRRRLYTREVEDPQRIFHISASEMILNRPMGLLTPHQSRTTWVLLASI